MAKYADEVKQHLGQAAITLQVAKDHLHNGQYESSASSAAESAAHTCRALLLDEGIDPERHGDVITLVHQIFVQGRRLTQEQGEKLSWLFQLGEARKSNAGDEAPLIFGEVQKAVEFAGSFFEAAKVIIEA